MKRKETAFVQQLKTLLAELPLDSDQRQSVAANVSSLPQSEAEAITERLARTLSDLRVTVDEVNELMTNSQIRVTSDTSQARALALSVCESA